jgi:transcription elongation factor Elf1
MYKNSSLQFQKTITYPSSFVCAECKEHSTINSTQDHENLVCLSCSALYKEQDEKIKLAATIDKRSTIFDQPCK